MSPPVTFHKASIPYIVPFFKQTIFKTLWKLIPNTFYTPKVKLLAKQMPTIQVSTCILGADLCNGLSAVSYDLYVP